MKKPEPDRVKLYYALKRAGIRPNTRNTHDYEDGKKVILKEFFSCGVVDRDTYQMHVMRLTQYLNY